jgi:hypothetical protein
MLFWSLKVIDVNCPPTTDTLRELDVRELMPIDFGLKEVKVRWVSADDATVKDEGTTPRALSSAVSGTTAGWFGGDTIELVLRVDRIDVTVDWPGTIWLTVSIPYWSTRAAMDIAESVRSLLESLDEGMVLRAVEIESRASRTLPTSSALAPVNIDCVRIELATERDVEQAFSESLSDAWVRADRLDAQDTTASTVGFSLEPIHSRLFSMLSLMACSCSISSVV